VTPREVFDEISPDIPYYQGSGGGVTLSGGEVLCQPDFAREILSLCRASSIGTAIETGLNAGWEELGPLLGLTDIVMADIKHSDETVHRRFTGVSNARILDNLHRISNIGIPLIVRTPVIPGANDHEDDISRIGGFLAELESLRYYELLNYNPLGVSKYDALGITYSLDGIKPLESNRMEALASAARKHGIEVRCG
jgi:pyruvate formate lyase activating enzyme